MPSRIGVEFTASEEGIRCQVVKLYGKDEIPVNKRTGRRTLATTTDFYIEELPTGVDATALAAELTAVLRRHNVPAPRWPRRHTKPAPQSVNTAPPSV